MPKVRTKSTTAIKRNHSRKDRVGTRKAGTSAHQMSTQDLLTALKSAGRKRYKTKILNTLRKRGVEV